MPVWLFVKALLGKVPTRVWGIAGAAIAVGLLLMLLLDGREAKVQARAEAAIAAGTIETMTRTRAADEAADVARADDGARILAEARQLEEVGNAVPDQRLADRSRARLECVRAQQAARARGERPPACGRLGRQGGAGGSGDRQPG